MAHPRGGPLYKIVPRADWDEAAASLPWAPIDRQDGFVHLSAAHQVRGTAAKHFAGRDDLVLVEVDPARLAPDTLRWEVSRGGDRFPHVYGDVPRAAIGPATPLTDPFPAHVPEPLPDEPLPGVVARRLELAEAAAMIAFGRAGGEHLVAGAAVATRFGPRSPLNAVKGWGLSGDLAADLTAFEQWFGDADFAVEVSSHAASGALDVLGARGYRCVEVENVLFRTLDAAPPPAATAALVPADDPAAWGRRLATAFADGAEPPDGGADAAAIARASQCRAFTVTVDGEPAGGCAMRIEHDLALLMATAILPEHRGRGLQQAALALRLGIARQLGCRFAKVDVAPGSTSHRNAHRAGFHLSHVRLAFRR